jgi:hypothetical protein
MVVGASSSPYFRSSGKTESLIRIDSAALRPEGVYGGMLLVAYAFGFCTRGYACTYEREMGWMELEARWQGVVGRTTLHTQQLAQQRAPCRAQFTEVGG